MDGAVGGDLTFRDDLADLHKDALRIAAILTLSLGYVWLQRNIYVLDTKTLPSDIDAFVAGWIGCLVLLSTPIVSYVMKERHLRIARHVFVWGLLAAAICAMLAFHLAPTAYALILPITFAGVLLSEPAFWLIAALSHLVVLWIDPLEGVLAIPLLSQPILTLPVRTLVRLLSPSVAIAFAVLTLVTVAAWLSSRNLYTALAWFRSGYRRARHNERVAQERRGELERALKALDEAYYRLERANYMLMLARDQAEEARRLKQQFAQNISHELRTPLNLIIGFSETMANAPETYTGVTWTPALRGDVDQIYRSSRHLSSMIDDVLDLSAVEAKQLGLVLEEVDPEDVICDAVSVMEALYGAKNLSLRVAIAPDLPCLHLDPTRVRQVLLNLLANASRHTPAGGVTVSARVVEDMLEIAVSDTGVGIAPHDVPKVFDEFRRVSAPGKEVQQGSGLGIPLSKRLIELHGGRMWLKSTPGEGTTFFFTLPLSLRVTGEKRDASSDAGESVRRMAKPARPALRKALLVVDDDPLILHTLRYHLDRYEVLSAVTGGDLMELVERHQPVALVRDVSDDELLEAARGNGGDGGDADVPDQLPVIHLPLDSGFGSARRLGLCDYLIKPVTRQQLQQALDRLDADPGHVLIVDDDPQLVELLCRMLESLTVDVSTSRAFDGQQALTAMHKRKPDLVLLDLVMPGLDGLGVLSAMQQEPFLADLPVIAVSGRGYLDFATGGRALSVVRDVPFNPADLLAFLKVVLDTLPVPAGGLGGGRSA